ncbi:uncharacterized protein LOC119085149 isoform X6 [Bradysia coprophila]|uniref:uncharacterized protein LOC119085149 isoform X6 n=1 Tax=Bradysia coprophila TaxID=38358 RepID=UPI00187DAB10|nr:uncharacterized protein LOC119085149 isoform X6 [Bradysia coprophila]
MAVTRSHSLKQRETVDTGTTVKARQTTPQPTKKGKPKKKRNKTSARKATKTPKIGNGQVVAQQKDPSTDPELPLQMVSIPTDIVYKLNISKMQHFVVNEIKDEVDTSVDATLSQSSAHSIEQEPLQSDSTADSTKSIDSTLSAGEPVEKPLSADKMNVRFVMDLQDYGIPILERLGHSSPSPMNADSLTVIKEESQSHLETVGDNNLSELTSASPQGVNSQQMVYHSGDREIKMNVRSVMDLQDYGIPIVERYGHSSSSSMNVDSLTVIREESPSHLETVGDNAISQELTSTSPQEVDSEKNLTQMIEMDTRTKSELKHSHPNVREECPSPASTIIKGGYEDEYLMSTETVISKGLEDECTSSNTIIKSQSENERPSHVIIESELVDECPSPTRTIIKSNLVADCLSPDIIIITSESDDECECPSPAATIIKSEFEDECSRPTTSINMENGADGIKLIERQSLDECLSPTKTTIRSESEAECPSPAATIIKSESEDECSRPTSPVIAENGATDQGLTQSQSFDECPSQAATIIKSESEDECPSPAATIIKSESEDECSRLIKAENVSSRNVRATEAVHNDSQDIFVDSELKTNQSTRCSGRSSLDNSLDRRASSSSLGALSSQKQRCGIDRRQKSFSKKQQTSNERCAATNSPTSSSKAFHRPSSFSDSRRSASTFESKRVFESDSGSEWDGESDSERVRLQRPKFERNKRPSSNAKKRMGYRWSDIRFSVTPEKKFMEIDTTDDSEPEYGWEDPRPPKRTCVEPKSTQELDPNLHEKMQIFIGKLSNEFDLDVIEQSRKKLFEAIDESIAVQSTKKLSELDLKIQKKKDDYVLNLFGTDEFESWDNDPALSNVEATNKFGPLKLPAAANASLLDKMTRKHWENGI